MAVALLVSTLACHLHELVGLDLEDYFVLLEQRWRNCFVVVVDWLSLVLDQILRRMDLGTGYADSVVNLEDGRWDPVRVDAELD